MKIELIPNNLRKDKKIEDEFNNVASFLLDINNFLPNNSLKKISELANKIIKEDKTLVVIGIGGSYLGAKAIVEALGKREVIFLGYNLDPLSLKKAIYNILDKDIIVNVISKSGNTLETKATYSLILEFLKEKYPDSYSKRLIFTTNNKSGFLLEEAKRLESPLFEVPDLIGGRFSVFTAVGLLPIAASGVDISSFLVGFQKGLDRENAYLYALSRKSEEEKGKNIEVLAIYNECLISLAEWFVQLFGESTGKNNKGIFPVWRFFTRDLHSLGQYLQEGKRLMFETIIKLNTGNRMYVKDYHKTLEEINNIVLSSVREAHLKGNVNSNLIELDLTPSSLASFMSFMMLSASYSALLDNLNPFDQPGVEEYKKLVNEKL